MGQIKIAETYISKRWVVMLTDIPQITVTIPTIRSIGAVKK